MLQDYWIGSKGLKSWEKSLKFKSLDFYLQDSVREGLRIVNLMAWPNCNKDRRLQIT